MKVIYCKTFFKKCWNVKTDSCSWNLQLHSKILTKMWLTWMASITSQRKNGKLPPRYYAEWLVFKENSKIDAILKNQLLANALFLQFENFIKRFHNNFINLFLNEGQAHCLSEIFLVRFFTELLLWRFDCKYWYSANFKCIIKFLNKIT